MYIAAESLKRKPDGWIVSIVAGVSMDSLKEAFKTDKIIRCMPNTPAVVMEAMTVWTAFKNCPPEIKKKAKVLMGSMGEELFVTDESYIDMATAISGSGPAVSLHSSKVEMNSNFRIVCFFDYGSHGRCCSSFRISPRCRY